MNETKEDTGVPEGLSEHVVSHFRPWALREANSIACDLSSGPHSRDYVIGRIASSIQHPTFQARVVEWAQATFSPDKVTSMDERRCRFMEESAELCQAAGMSASQAHAVIDYVFQRDVGEAFQEVGGVMTTLAVLCHAMSVNMQYAAETELSRVWTKVDKIRAKNLSKPRFPNDAPRHVETPDRMERVLNAILEPLKQSSSVDLDTEIVIRRAWERALRASQVNQSFSASADIAQALQTLTQKCAESADSTRITYDLLPVLYKGHAMAPYGTGTVITLRAEIAAEPKFMEPMYQMVTGKTDLVLGLPDDQQPEAPGVLMSTLVDNLFDRLKRRQNGDIGA